MIEPVPPAAGPSATDPPPPRPLPPRLASKYVVLTWVAALLLVLVLVAVGGAPVRSFAYLGAGAACCLLAVGAWEIVARRGERGGFLAWAAFPVAWLGGLAQVPFLALAVYPPAELLLVGTPPVVAWIVEDVEGARLRVRFPRSIEMKREVTGNLALDGYPVPRAAWTERPTALAWIDSATLSVDFRALVPGGPRSIVEVSINGDLSAEHFAFQGGEVVPAQVVRVRSPDEPAPRNPVPVSPFGL